MPEREVSVLLADEAVSDIREIYQHIATGNAVAVADDIYRQLRAAIERIGQHPKSGAPRDYVRPGLRIVPVSSWVIWYREQESGRGVLILRVLHGRMDADRHLLR